jgi:hypothetical protein
MALQGVEAGLEHAVGDALGEFALAPFVAIELGAPLAETPPADAADALAIGLAHLQASDPIRAKLLDRHLI